MYVGLLLVMLARDYDAFRRTPLLAGPLLENIVRLNDFLKRTSLCNAPRFYAAPEF